MLPQWSAWGGWDLCYGFWGPPGIPSSLSDSCCLIPRVHWRWVHLAIQGENTVKSVHGRNSVNFNSWLFHAIKVLFPLSSLFSPRFRTISAYEMSPFQLFLHLKCHGQNYKWHTGKVSTSHVTVDFYFFFSLLGCRVVFLISYLIMSKFASKYDIIHLFWSTVPFHAIQSISIFQCNWLLEKG